MRQLSGALLRASTILWAPAAFAQTEQEFVPVANPGRPTVSTPATLTPAGYLQFETGGLYAAQSTEFNGRFGLNLVTKLTVTPRLQLLALTEPLVHNAGKEESGSRPGEVFAGLQAVVLQGEGTRPTVSLSYIRRLYESPAPEIDIGTFRSSVLLLVSEDLGKLHFDVNGVANEQSEGTLRRAQFGQTLSISHPLKAVSLSGELWHFSQPLVAGNAVGTLFAVSYPLRPNLVFDTGLNHGWTATSTRWEGFAGFTYVLPHRLWRTQGGKPGSHKVD